MDQERRAYHEQTLALLRTVLPSPRWSNPQFLEWVYDRNPTGPVVAQDLDRDASRICHIGGVPTLLRSADKERVFLLLLNSSSAPGEHGRGTYVKTLLELVERTRKSGLGGVYGVTNASSTGPVERVAQPRLARAAGIKKTGLVEPLPVKLHLPLALPAPGVTHTLVTPEYLDSADFARLADAVEATPRPKSGWALHWTADMLRWRLGWPGCRYTVHSNQDLMAVTTTTSEHHIRFGVLVMTASIRHGDRPVDLDRMLASICWHHRVPAVVYAGFNPEVRVSGFKLSQERLPAPLNLAVQSVAKDIPDADFVMSTFEFIDFDAY